jgi:ZIP family zinc transporter
VDLDLPDVLVILASGLATTVGGLALLVVRRPSPRLLDGLLGFTAGVMLAAAFFSLLLPALERGGLGQALGGFLAGAATLALLDVAVPHVHARFVEPGHEDDPRIGAQRRAILLLSALTIHNLPEGMAVGLAFAAGGPELGVPTALAIGLQNVPEGFAAAAPLLESGTPRGRAVAFAAATGAVEPPAAFLAAATASIAGLVLAGGLGFAAGAMIYVVVDELIPESHARGNADVASRALLGGFALMMVLDTAFG